MGVSCTPEKVTRVFVTGRFRIWAALLDTNVIDDPESSRARTCSVFPPGPVRVTCAVIIRISGMLGDFGASELAATAGVVGASLWTMV